MIVVLKALAIAIVAVLTLSCASVKKRIDDHEYTKHTPIFKDLDHAKFSVKMALGGKVTEEDIRKSEERGWHGKKYKMEE